MITLWETLPHYGRHLKPISAELTRRRIEHRYIAGLGNIPYTGDVLITAAYRDLMRNGRRFGKTVLVEHGIGQSYSNGHHAYTGGTRRRYDLHLTPGPACVDEAARGRVEVGCLPLTWLKPQLRARTEVGLTWHWPCTIAPEAGSALDEYRGVLPQLAAWATHQDAMLLGHQHPRWAGALNATYHGALIESTRSADELLTRCDLLVADNTSLLLEAAAFGLPVVVVNSRHWRRAVEHGKRFWAWADVGLQVNEPGELIRVVAETLCCDPQAARRAEVVRECYGVEPTGGAARAADAILGLL